MSKKMDEKENSAGNTPENQKEEKINEKSVGKNPVSPMTDNTGETNENNTEILLPEFKESDNTLNPPAPPSMPLYGAEEAVNNYKNQYYGATNYPYTNQNSDYTLNDSETPLESTNAFAPITDTYNAQNTVRNDSNNDFKPVNVTLNGENNAPVSYPIVKEQKGISNTALFASNIFNGVVGISLVIALIGTSGYFNDLINADANYIKTVMSPFMNQNKKDEHNKVFLKTSKHKANAADYLTDAAKKTSRAVVAINATTDSGVHLGSGAFISSDGYIVTDYHVVKDANNIYLTLSNGEIVTANIKGFDAVTDLAVLKANNLRDKVHFLSFADSNNVVQAQQVFTIGNPMGYKNTLTMGYVSNVSRAIDVTSADDRSYPVTVNTIQYNMSANHGNSGGVIVDEYGDIQSVISSIAVPSKLSKDSIGTSITFGVPSNTVKNICESIINKKSFIHAYMGIMVTDGTAQISQNNVLRNAAIVKDVAYNSPAWKAGIRKDDAIIGFGNKQVPSAITLVGYTNELQAGNTAILTVVRNGKVSNAFVRTSPKIFGKDFSLMAENLKKYSNK